ncbi:MAG: 1-deoxy-D-xylulose-5-phosphate reductoisomerase [Muribaculaceae bacterium]|nr:1-deoxy-D-xylulose-5-phosphate reductoisomerase [Muribaculaceae bacterium]
MKNIAILGSTGSIGTQTLDIVAANPDLFNVSVLTANNNWELLAQQAREFNPKAVVISNRLHYDALKDALKDTGILILSDLKDLDFSDSTLDIDLVLTALVGYSGVLPTINAIKAKKTIALANKETLVVAGEIVTTLAKANDVKILPVDSEHSAIFQCLVGENRNKMKKILLTASGGPFRTWSQNDMKTIRVEDALKHPNWSMGAKVTIDSASMMNKGFEMIEARWLFDCAPSDIEILVHPQSIVHSMVEFVDGSVKAQLGVPDMHIPIQYALGYPERLSSPEFHLDWSKLHQLTFEQPDLIKFPLLSLAFSAIEKGGNMPCILNAANEIAVNAFLNRYIDFTEMPRMVEDIMTKVDFIKNPSLDDLIETNKISRQLAKDWIETH